MLEVHSPAFDDGGQLPIRFAAVRIGGKDVSPPLSWTGVPDQTRSLAVSCIDHAPVAREWLHWLVVDLPPDLPFLAEGASGSAMMPATARELPGTSDFSGYRGAGPPAGSGPHPYEYTVWALDVPALAVPAGADAAGFLAAVEGHVLGKGSTTAMFER